MNRIKDIFINFTVNSIGIYAVVFDNEIGLNVYTALTVIIFGLLSMVTFGLTVWHDNSEVQAALARISSKKELPTALKWFDRVCDITLLFVLFGWGHWWKGAAWFCIHFVFTAIIKDALMMYNKGVEQI